MKGNEEDRMRRAFKMFDRKERGVIDEEDLLDVYRAVMNLSPQTDLILIVLPRRGLSW